MQPRRRGSSGPALRHARRLPDDRTRSTLRDGKLRAHVGHARPLREGLSINGLVRPVLPVENEANQKGGLLSCATSLAELSLTRLTQARQKAGVARIIKEPGMEPVNAPAIGVPLDDNRSHVVLENLARYAAESQKCILVAPDQRLDPFIVAEFDIGGPAQPSVAMNTFNLSPPRPTVVQSACIWWPGAVSKRTTGSETGAGTSPRRNCFRRVRPQS